MSFRLISLRSKGFPLFGPWLVNRPRIIPSSSLCLSAKWLILNLYGRFCLFLE
ncbi:hypothetical protein HOLleu_24218 [Holothuria leucospilota]|uniref:Uncharacterized protein n=1 Tax=Holothuria leucospilota TaxID=206669 RepID=A0A9Q1BVX9_HOLLE|nr:hypothetical protein HOLleu_24218 [Holothuria leucospilota]